jgi:hypothetical protein
VLKVGCASVPEDTLSGDGMIAGMSKNLPVTEGEFRRFKQLLYGEAVSDWLGVYEAWWTANSYFPDLSLSERLRLAEQAMTELIEAGLVELYRGTWNERPGEAIASEESGPILREWSTWVIAPDASSVIWTGGDQPTDWASTLESL